MNSTAGQSLLSDGTQPHSEVSTVDKDTKQEDRLNFQRSQVVVWFGSGIEQMGNLSLSGTV
jgi:hypothetical protein